MGEDEPEESEKYPPRNKQLWRFDIPSDGPGTLSSGGRVGLGGIGLTSFPRAQDL